MRTLNAGYTLLELITAITICSLLLGFGIPGFNKYSERARSQVAIDQIYRAYQFARQHAVTHHEQVYLCGSNSGTTCDRSWKKTVIMFIDRDNNHAPDTSEIIQVQQIDATSASIKSHFALGMPYTILQPDGKASFTGSMIYCPTNHAQENINRVTWNNVGRPYKGVDLNADGMIDSTNREPLSNLCGIH